EALRRATAAASKRSDTGRTKGEGQGTKGLPFVARPSYFVPPQMSPRPGWANGSPALSYLPTPIATPRHAPSPPPRGRRPPPRRRPAPLLPRQRARRSRDRKRVEEGK